MSWLGEHTLNWTLVDNAARIHHQYVIAEFPHHSKVVGHKEISQSKLFLQVIQKIQDLRLYRYVQRGDRLIAYDESRFQDQRTGYTNTLALPSGECMGKSGGRLRFEMHTS